DERFVWRVTRVVDEALGPATAAVVERGAEFLRNEVMTRPPPRFSLARGDWLPKHLLIGRAAIVGVIDWELAGPASPAFDPAMWEVSARRPPADAPPCCAAGTCASRSESDSRLSAPANRSAPSCVPSSRDNP